MGDQELKVDEMAWALLSQVHTLVQAGLHRKGWTRAELAEALGVEEEHVGQALMDPRAVNLERLAKMCVALGVEPQIGEREV